MPYREILFVYYYSIDPKHINSMCGQNAEFLKFKLWSAESNYWSLNG
jgi:hypothetical protein